MNDFISRQEAIKELNILMKLASETIVIAENPVCVGVESAIRAIRHLPSAQPERKTGRWRRRLVDSGFNADWHCSECGWKTSIEEHGYNFCPNCGADMGGGDE